MRRAGWQQVYHSIGAVCLVRDSGRTLAANLSALSAPPGRGCCGAAGRGAACGGRAHGPPPLGVTFGHYPLMYFFSSAYHQAAQCKRLAAAYTCYAPVKVSAFASRAGASGGARPFPSFWHTVYSVHTSLSAAHSAVAARAVGLPHAAELLSVCSCGPPAQCCCCSAACMRGGGAFCTSPLPCSSGSTLGAGPPTILLVCVAFCLPACHAPRHTSSRTLHISLQVAISKKLLLKIPPSPPSLSSSLPPQPLMLLHSYNI